MTSIEWLQQVYKVTGTLKESDFDLAKKMEHETISKLKERIDDLENQILEMGERN